MVGDRTSLLRWTGLAGIAAAAAWTLGDALLLGNRATPAEFPHLAAYAGNARLKPTLVGRRYLPTATSAADLDHDDLWRVQHVLAAPLVAGWVCRFRLEHGDAEARFDVSGREQVVWDPFC